MKKLLTFIVIAVSFVAWSSTAKAYDYQTAVMEGSVGGYDIHMKLTFDLSTHKITGWYYYDSKGPDRKFKLSGTWSGSSLDDCKIKMQESYNGKVSGTFTGQFGPATMSGDMEWAEGIWTSTKGKKLKWNADHYYPDPDDFDD